MPDTPLSTAQMKKRRESLRPHRTRDAIVEVMRSHGEPISPTRLSKITGASLGSAAYHVRTLVSAGIVRLADEGRARGAVEHFYELVSETDEPLARERLLLQAAGGMAVPSNEGFPMLTELDDQAWMELTKELDKITPRVLKIATNAHKRVSRAKSRKPRK